MAKRKTPSKTQQANKTAYQKELKRIKQFIRRAEKRGYQFRENVIPKKPANITKASVNKLKKITPQSLYKKAIYGGEATGGEIVTGVQGRKAERKQASRKGAETRKQRKKQTIENYDTMPYTEFTDIVIANFKSDILRFPKEISDRVLSLVNQIITQQGANAVAEALQNMPETFYQILRRVGYDSESAMQELSTSLINYLPDVSEQYKCDLMDAFEMNELGYSIED